VQSSTAVNLFRQRLAAGFGGEPDDGHADQVDQAHDRAGGGVVFVEYVFHQVAGLQRGDGGQDAAEVEAESLSCRTHRRTKQLWRAQGQSAEERSRNAAGQTAALRPKFRSVTDIFDDLDDFILHFAGDALIAAYQNARNIFDRSKGSSGEEDDPSDDSGPSPAS
jgi:hypothetical protein